MPDQGLDHDLALDLIPRAVELAARVHAGQTDRAGVPYFHHVLTVALTVEHPTVTTIILALLHDAVEDTPGLRERAALRDEITTTFGHDMLALVDGMTHRDGEDYAEYIERLSGNAILRRVKRADLRHNMRADRLPAGTPHGKMPTYERAYARLDQIEHQARAHA